MQKDSWLQLPFCTDGSSDLFEAFVSCYNYDNVTESYLNLLHPLDIVQNFTGQTAELIDGSVCLPCTTVFNCVTEEPDDGPLTVPQLPPLPLYNGDEFYTKVGVNGEAWPYLFPFSANMSATQPLVPDPVTGLYTPYFDSSGYGPGAQWQCTFDKYNTAAMIGAHKALTKTLYDSCAFTDEDDYEGEGYQNVESCAYKPQSIYNEITVYIDGFDNEEYERQLAMLTDGLVAISIDMTGQYTKRLATAIAIQDILTSLTGRSISICNTTYPAAPKLWAKEDLPKWVSGLRDELDGTVSLDKYLHGCS